MVGIIFVAAALASAAPECAPLDAAVFALELRGVDGVLQQGRGGGGGKQDDGGGRAQGGGGQRETRGSQGGGRDDAPRTERRQGGGGGQSARSSSGGGSDRAESGRGRSSSSSSSSSSSGEARGNRGSGRSDDAGGSSSAAARNERGSGNGGSSASSGGARGRSDDAARGNSASGASNAAARGADARGGRGRMSGQDLRTRIDALPPRLRQMAASSRPSERMVAGAVARGHGRGLDANAFDVRSDGGRLRVLNRSGALLLDLDDDRARRLGGWDLRRLGDRRPAGNAPAFCRSGAGHPVFGREWCLDRGFGLGSRNGTLWSRGGIEDVIWRRRTDDRLDRGGLVGVLGDIVLGRLALQAMTLGYDQPLAGVWVAQPEGPRLLRVSSGDYEVAELVDTNRDDRVDVLYVVQPVW